jgi:hypothetical protein
VAKVYRRTQAETLRLLLQAKQLLADPQSLQTVVGGVEEDWEEGLELWEKIESLIKNSPTISSELNDVSLANILHSALYGEADMVVYSPNLDGYKLDFYRRRSGWLAWIWPYIWSGKTEAWGTTLPSDPSEMAPMN